MNKLNRIDLNLLVQLDVLFEELNVTRAAQRLYLSQSAVSKNLAKLREQFDDPLFNRTPQGLSPTPRALKLQPKIRQMVHQLEQITEPEIFLPQTSQHRFQIAAVESVYPLVLPYFMPEVFNHAPNINFSTHTWDRNTFKRILDGELDMGITGKDIDIRDARLTMLAPHGIAEQEIYRDEQMCVVRHDHPVLKQDWNLETYLASRHVQVRCDGNDRWLLDYRLADQGLERDIAITVPDFNSAASLCTYSDLVFTAPAHFTKMVSHQLGLKLLPLPMDFPPMAYTLFWSKERESDPAIHWLKQIIVEKTAHLR
ncbi:LysR substrate-binding domain-containing protein [Vibrio astriarenae]|uniref:LysR substrate-binding domain-containing protein n=1 Tax=Vibrio agarivorans TaxID=153622 RepID=A0ABT7XW92_9VIBR|nr:LysR substrate-binding domain-containing protein [Vibrio agarivorans]MDN2479824.1 LysR substrate-binding domain-containing protein [Vibrio agarivorans]